MCWVWKKILSFSLCITILFHIPIFFPISIFYVFLMKLMLIQLSVFSGLPTIIVNENMTQVIYLLPYRFHLFYAIENMRTYMITYALELPFVFISGFGQSAADCIMVTLVFHICGQMSVLVLRINNINIDPFNCRSEMRQVVWMHIRLLR